MSDKRPELGNVQVGDKIIVLDRGRRETRETDATVTRVARVWITATRNDDYPTEYRLRRDTQTDGSDVGTPLAFRTPEQHAWHQREAAAEAFLKEAGIEISRWGRGGRYVNDKVTLANIIRRHEGLPEL